MSTASVSNLSTQTSMRLTIRQAQNELLKSQQEVSTGFYADIGAELGSKTSTVVDLNRESLRLNSMISNNSIATQRLSASQEALKQIATAAEEMNNALITISGSSNSDTINTTIMTVSNSLSTMTSMANQSANGEFLFAGINTDVQPIAEYTDTSAAKTAFDAAFTTYFGFPPTDTAGTATIAATGTPSMEDFITTVLEPMFTGADWTTNWSSATDQAMTSRITQSETVQTSASANENGFRYFALAAIVTKELMTIGAPANAVTTAINKAIDYTGRAITGINSTRSELGLSQNRIEKADASLKVQVDIIETSLSSKIEVDAYEASTRVNSLLSMVEASYTLTSKIQALSLVNYL
ncbi:flagellar hook-associated family protein [Rhizobium rosettiformans]|jgi:flagellar hook-associated protein 3 FlgL|uniref:Flagellin n=2 Tax=Rhizobium rosettiformans TaxID=1368430 RepID=A0A4S8PZT4_9HYPH|nr:flagellar hook-associated family protein [Rhizobium rosettiformans]MBA4795891.1 flagellar hook-associated family protein [Hyphomicrobiales bacterium]MBB5277471.1 flagellar hook-associated protein 3 FlgL [Rhizobium rosettiformans]MDR7028593.1 flagellar hook-associated protein 3 FlgL [Rhizobium rosettiformans]MDR7064125.1 flagellar hook-associated protein 3 FlgL [Rhizobium rosettiformans]THV33799.1 flagellar hook-associated family protein [Rhizobium rosettiformans W3]